MKNLKAALRPNLMRILSTEMQDYFSTLNDYIPILLENGHPRKYVEARVKEILGNDKSKEVCTWLYDWLEKNDADSTLNNNTQNVKNLKLAAKTSAKATNSSKKTAGESNDDEVLWPKPKKSSIASKNTKTTKSKPAALRRSISSTRSTRRDSSASSINTFRGTRSVSCDRSVSVSTDRSTSASRGNKRYRPYPRQNQRHNNSWRRPGSLGVPSVNRPMGPLKCAVCQERFFHMPRLQDHMKSHFGGVGGDNTKPRRNREAPNAYDLWFHKARRNKERITGFAIVEGADKWCGIYSLFSIRYKLY